MPYTFAPLTEAEARDIVSWRYEPPYDIYNGHPDLLEDSVAWLLTPAFQYHAIHDENMDLIGFCCFGEDATVPGGLYPPDALDIGIGLRPELTGQGLGVPVLTAILAHALRTYEPTAFRATIATFNLRSQAVFRHLWFVPEMTFVSERGREFVIVRRPA